MTTQFQFLRVEPFKCSMTANLLLEADRAPTHTSHIEKPLPPRWLFGSPQIVHKAVDDLMAQKRAVRAKDGQVHLRKQRSDFRGLLGGISSYPVPIESFSRSTSHEQNLLRSWIVDSDAFFASEFGPAYIAAVLHSDESCPHLHHYVVGPAAHLHPGLRAELENGRRIDDDRERLRRYRQAMRDFLDRYHAHVGCKYGHKRSGNIRPSPRVPDRKSYLVQKQAERLFQEMGASNAEVLARIIYERHAGHR